MTELLREPVAAHEWPCAEIHRTPTDFEVEVETPGFQADELEVEVEGHTLAVVGKPEHGHEGAAFSFTFTLPPDTNLERLHAAFSDGVLTIEAPLLRRDGKRTLEIERPHLVHPAATGS
ncbi:MAG TPA: Hsp20 family protein [Gaiellaceae bacterium]|nr:Hsp20 family protein [Gaiellaceae bacterium]